MEDLTRPTSRRRLLHLGSLSLLGAALHPASAFAEGPALQQNNVVETDLCIYGGTSAGVAAAVQARRMGKRVALIEAGAHLGGMTASGLGETDYGNRAAIGGIAREFYRRVGEYYVRTYGEGSAQARMCRGGLRFEPRAAEKVFTELTLETGVNLYLRHRLKYVRAQKSRVVEIGTENGRVFRAGVFIDATYEGDLMAQAGVSYTVGREANRTYDETLNGVQWGHPLNNFKVPVDPYRVPGQPSSGLLPYVSAEDGGRQGEGDGRVQAYCFRLCLTNQPGNRLPFKLPRAYDPDRYALLARYIQAGVWDALRFNGRIPNGKVDVNNHGAFSLDHIGASYAWPDGDAVTREKIFQDHLLYTQGLLWFLGHDERVPVEIRSEVNQWGLPRDEFPDNDNWPHQLYVREGRRMISDYVMTEHNCRGRVRAEDSVGLGAYTMDSHNCQRVVREGRVVNEGDVQIGIPAPYPISFRAIVPKEGECTNLLVPVCLSSTHIAFGSIRMEPVFMILGQSAATAASFALDDGVPVQRVDVSRLQNRLAEDGQVLWPSNIRPAPPPPDQAAVTGPVLSPAEATIDPKTLKGIVLDDVDAARTGEWSTSLLSNPRRVGPQYLHDSNAGKGNLSVTYKPEIPENGSYTVVMIFPPTPNAASNVPVTIAVEGVGTATVRVNQRQAEQNGFHTLGTFKLPKGQGTTVTVQNRGTDGYVLADAVQFIPLEV